MKILFAERGYRCEECGYAYTDDSRKQKGPYEPHHVDGDNTNWKKENVKIVCLNCHWKTPNYRFRGKKHSSESKKKISLNNYWNRTLSYPNLAEEAGLNPVK